MGDELRARVWVRTGAVKTQAGSGAHLVLGVLRLPGETGLGVPAGMRTAVRRAEADVRLRRLALAEALRRRALRQRPSLLRHHGGGVVLAGLLEEGGLGRGRAADG